MPNVQYCLSNICNSDTIFTQDLVRAGFSWDIRHVSVDSGYAAWPPCPPARARPGSTTKVYSSMQRDERGDREAEDSFGLEYSINWGWVRKGLKVVEGFSVLRLTYDGGVGIFPLSFCVPGHRVLL